jgi:hypothetical protein
VPIVNWPGTEGASLEPNCRGIRIAFARADEPASQARDGLRGVEWSAVYVWKKREHVAFRLRRVEIDSRAVIESVHDVTGKAVGRGEDAHVAGASTSGQHGKMHFLVRVEPEVGQALR